MTQSTSKGRLITAWILSGLVILFMLFDAINKFIQPEPVVEGTLELGFAQHHIAVIGLLALISTILYSIPKTSVTGVVLLTAFWGGAIATHVRLDNPLFSHTLFPVYLAVLAWGGLWLRNESLRKVIPITEKS